MKKVVVMVIRDEEFFIDMALDSICPYVEGIYILDTGSKDRTLEIVDVFSKQYPNKIVVESKDFGGASRFAPGYQEMNARNFALERATELLNPDWIICMDGDETFAPKFWSHFGTTITMDDLAVGHPTECPTFPFPTLISRHPESMVDWGIGQLLHDPHVRSWNAKKQHVRWIHPEGRHVVLSADGRSDLSCPFRTRISEPLHFHFHHAFGPKSIYSWLYWGLTTQPGDPNGILPEGDIYNQAIYEKGYPHLFNDKGQFVAPKVTLQKNVSLSIPLPEDYKFSDLVIKRWTEWGDYSL